ncbi:MULTISPECIES: hypothetical protein [Jannaschia]|uniref:hypothetical protein n=1 Tax=Jannaschia TaxID=188905 RepID=UPI001C7DAFE0|nr:MULTISPECIES: hypothetical protein [unclassified Jannaschia]
MGRGFGGGYRILAALERRAYKARDDGTRDHRRANYDPGALIRLGRRAKMLDRPHRPNSSDPIRKGRLS